MVSSWWRGEVVAWNLLHGCLECDQGTLFQNDGDWHLHMQLIELYHLEARPMYQGV
jgi:hypothetical protein